MGIVIETMVLELAGLDSVVILTFVLLKICPAIFC